MGRNGMGKTTLLRSVLGLVRPRRGEGRIAGVGHDTGGDARDRAHGDCLRAGGRGIFPNLSVRENLSPWLRAPVSMAAANGTFERVMQTFPRLSERLRNGGAQLSGGEQQMLTIGRALMTNPDLLILDEATEGLAPINFARNLGHHRPDQTGLRHRRGDRGQDLRRRVGHRRPR